MKSIVTLIVVVQIIAGIIALFEGHEAVINSVSKSHAVHIERP